MLAAKHAEFRQSYRKKTPNHLVRRQPGTMVGNDIRFSEQPSADTDENLAWCMVDGRHEFRSAASGAPIAQFVTIDINNIGTYSISPDQKKFAVVSRQKANPSENAVEVFDIATQKRLAYMWLPKGSFFDIAFAADNDRVLVATWDSVEIADTTQKRFISRLDLGWTPPPVKKEPEYSALSAGPFITAFENNETGGEQPQRAPRRLVSKLAVSSNNVVATADNDGHVKLWDLNSGQLLKELPNNPDEEINDITFSPNGQWLAYHIDGVLHVVDVADIEPLTTEQAATRANPALEIPQSEGSDSFVPEASATAVAKQPSENEAEQGFVSIFDGKTLNRWNATGDASCWSVLNGAIVGRGSRSHLLFADSFADFHLRADVKISRQGNGGLYVRARQGADHPEGYEVQIAGNGFAAAPWAYTGSIYELASVDRSVIRDDTWFRLDVSAVGNRIAVSIDGNAVLEFVDDSYKYSSGQLALQTWSPNTTIAFKNIQVRRQ